MTAKQIEDKKFLYRQGVASLRIEGMSLELKQHKMALEYHSGKISHKELIDKAIAYARTR